MFHFAELPPDDRERAKRISTIWNALDSDDDTGGAPLEVLEQLRREVSECLYRAPPDISRAEGFTAQALLLIAGSGEL